MADPASIAVTALKTLRGFVSLLAPGNKDDESGGGLKLIAFIIATILVFLLFILAAIPAAFLSIPFARYEKITSIYETVTDIQENFKNEGEAVELPWVDIAALAGVVYQDYSKLTKSDVRNIAEKFIRKEKEKRTYTKTITLANGKKKKITYTKTVTVYYVRSFGDVADMLELSSQEEERARRYIQALKEGGLKPPLTWKAAPEPGWAWPVPGYDRGSDISCGYGFRIHPITHKPNNHSAIDIVARRRAPVVAAHDGRVEKIVQDEEVFGNYVIIRGEKYYSKYAHLSEIYVRKGQSVKAGEVIGTVGNTGLSTGPHLHFEVKEKKFFKDKYKNPLDYYGF
ncbi:MAG: Peptidase [Clostridiales bacterium]|jgi:murein DD-endopeptidase MepM/ murein hydrolase activator NlpD|nr:Peptidase [Clostridiales bacterium]